MSYDTRTVGSAVLAILLMVSGCRGEGATDLLQQERINVTTWTLPASATIGAGLRVNGQGAEASWEISAPMTWEQYCAWSKERGKFGYRETRSGDHDLSFSRSLPGDLFTVDIAVVSPGPPLDLRVTFTARPY